MTGNAKRGKTAADKAKRKPISGADFIARVLAEARSAKQPPKEEPAKPDGGLAVAERGAGRV